MIEIKLINYQTQEYIEELKLRDEVLRKPLGMSICNDSLDKENEDTHIGAFYNDLLIAVLILTKINQKEIKMRQFAVNEDFRLQKIGTQLVDYSETFCKLNGYESIKLNARKSAVGFYLKLGYKIQSDEFTEVGIQHFKMEKRLI